MLMVALLSDDCQCDSQSIQMPNARLGLNTLGSSEFELVFTAHRVKF